MPVTSPPARRPQWRGERRPVLARLPLPLADQLSELARQRGCSLSDAVSDLLTHSLSRLLAREPAE